MCERERERARALYIAAGNGQDVFSTCRLKALGSFFFLGKVGGTYYVYHVFFTFCDIRKRFFFSPAGMKSVPLFVSGFGPPRFLYHWKSSGLTPLLPPGLIGVDKRKLLLFSLVDKTIFWWPVTFLGCCDTSTVVLGDIVSFLVREVQDIWRTYNSLLL